MVKTKCWHEKLIDEGLGERNNSHKTHKRDWTCKCVNYETYENEIVKQVWISTTLRIFYIQLLGSDFEHAHIFRSSFLD